jgi:hypothetical protein
MALHRQTFCQSVDAVCGRTSICDGICLLIRFTSVVLDLQPLFSISVHKKISTLERTGGFLSKSNIKDLSYGQEYTTFAI